MTVAIRDEKGVGLQLDQGLTIGYDKPIAEVAESIALERGIHFLLARNGRGKTTLLKTAAGLLPAIKGSYDLQGDCKFMADDLSFDRELNASMVFQAFLPKSRRDDALAFAERLELDTRKPFGKLSFGNRKKVGLVVSECSLRGNDVILYDEPFTGLDTPTRVALLERWNETGDEALRLVSCHPDLDEMAMPSALLITEGRITRAGGGGKTWAELKKLLN
ncbi:ATP-binding cassette domain-containing protein [Haloferula sp.]|uniref:ATP-binding cassette domain-containing protein n=1 Tax=Haloferula sp. TaxID=2497595 RepID=UPI00329D45D1